MNPKVRKFTSIFGSLILGTILFVGLLELGLRLLPLVIPEAVLMDFNEVLRVLDSVQLTSKHKVATPVNWNHGDKVIILPAVSDEDALKKFPQGWDSPKPYIRFVDQPGD